MAALMNCGARKSIRGTALADRGWKSSARNARRAPCKTTALFGKKPAPKAAPKKKGLFSFNKPEPKPEQQMAKADWLGLGGFTLDNFIAGGKDRDGGKLSDVAIKGQVRFRNRDGDEFILINPTKERLMKKDRFGFTVNDYLALQSSFGKKKGQQLNASQQKALRMRITGTARDFFKAGIVQYQGKYVESGWTDKKTVSNTNSSSLIGVGVALVGIMATLVLVASQTS